MDSARYQLWLHTQALGIKTIKITVLQGFHSLMQATDGKVIVTHNSMAEINVHITNPSSVWIKLV